MSETQQSHEDEKREPRGFGEHTRGLSGELAHEQGWGLNEENRTREAATPEDADGGADYNYGARDFGDEPVNTGITDRAPIQNSQADSTNKE